MSLPTPYNYTTPDWAPLERAVNLAGLPLPICGQFMWMMEEPMGVHHYKHRDSRRYALLTMDSTNAVERLFVALDGAVLRPDLYVASSL